MHTFIMEDWLTVRGPGSDTITQEETHWLDLEAFQDVVFYLECPNATSSPLMIFQTSPAKDESLFQTMTNATLSGASGAQVIPVLLSGVAASGSPPVARYVRWQISGPVGSAWDATFRIVVAANSPGM